jgi:hypothetical protein
MNAIEVGDLRQRYGALGTVAGVSVAVEHGEVLCLLGPRHARDPARGRGAPDDPLPARERDVIAGSRADL